MNGKKVEKNSLVVRVDLEKKDAVFELKKRRVQLVLRPSTYQKAKRIASENHISVNDMVSKIIEGIVE